jgi:dihydroorotate dehydrogenase
VPDWSYHTLFTPALRRLPGHQARDATLGLIGALARLPGGAALIAAFGHMHPPPGASAELLGLQLPSPIGISGELDPWLIGTAGLARLGVGFIEIGPVTVDGVSECVSPRLSADGHSLVLADAPIGPGLDATRRRLGELGGLPVPFVVRVSALPESSPSAALEQLTRLIGGLSPWAAAFVLETRWSIEHLAAAEIQSQLSTVRRLVDRPLLLALAPDVPRGRLSALIAGGVTAGFDGWVISGGLRGAPGLRCVGPASRAPVLEIVCHVRELVGRDKALLAGGGVDQPADALELLRAGANVVLLHSGLISAGPGLPKRINEAVAACAPPNTARLTAPAGAVPTWLPLFLLGLGMLLGGALAWLIAATRVVLPYDEAFLGLDRDALPAINARLLAFMAHDRVTLAGTMLSLGVLYSVLALWGVRAGAHWAWQAMIGSASVGFASFFLFLGFGYFDPLHAAVSVPLLVLFVLGLRNGPVAGQTGHATPGLHNDRAWRLSQWGQLCFVALGVGLALAGLAIALIGIGGVLVPEDLRFLDSPSATLRAANPRLLPLVAHDRAGFGGALVSDGIGVLLVALWGYRAGARWVWWALLGAGLPGFAAALGVHLAVGYLDAYHLGPALVGLVVFCVGLVLSRPYLMARPDRAAAP